MEETLSKLLRTGLLNSHERDEESSRFLGMMHRLTELLGAHTDQPPHKEFVYQELARIVIEETDFEKCSVILWDDKVQELRPRAAFCLDDLLGGGLAGKTERRVLNTLEAELADRAFRSRTPVFVENGKFDRLSPEAEGSMAPQTLVCLPLLDQGVLCISSPHHHLLSPQAKRNWELIGRIVGVFINRMVRWETRAAGVGGVERRGYDCPPLDLWAGNLDSQGLPMPERAIESTPQGICLLDVEGNILHANRSLERRHGLEGSQLSGCSPAVLFSTPSDFRELLQRAEGTEMEEMTNVSMVTTGGQSYLADIDLVRLSSDQGGNSGFLLVIHDMTKRNTLTEKLLQTEKLAALGLMAGGVAHDFNNLLMAILGNIQLVLPSITEQDTQRRLQNIEKAVQDGADTVRRLQKLTEKSRDSKSVSLTVDVGEAVTDVIELTRPRWKNATERLGHNIRFQLDLEPRCYASISPSDLREVLTNLMFNAVEAMPEGGLIRFACKSEEDSVVIDVADNGMGMSEEVSTRVFDPFFSTKGAGNSGLGLSVCWSLIARNEGEIRLRSTPGKGTSFQITLPRALAPSQTRQTESPRSITDSYRLLVVDDDPEILEVLRDMLRLKGHRVTATTNPQEALDLIDSNRYDLVLTDLGMPSVSGWEIAKHAKTTQPHLPVILITGWGAQYEEDDLTVNGVDHVLSKPLSWDRLIDTVSQMLSPGAPTHAESTLYAI